MRRQFLRCEERLMVCVPHNHARVQSVDFLTNSRKYYANDEVRVLNNDDVWRSGDNLHVFINFALGERCLGAHTERERVGRCGQEENPQFSYSGSNLRRHYHVVHNLFSGDCDLVCPFLLSSIFSLPLRSSCSRIIIKSFQSTQSIDIIRCPRRRRRWKYRYGISLTKSSLCLITFRITLVSLLRCDVRTCDIPVRKGRRQISVWKISMYEQQQTFIYRYGLREFIGMCDVIGTWLKV